MAEIGPAPGPEAPKALNIRLTFEEALKLHFGLGQLLGKLNSYNRSTAAGKRSAACLCLYLRKRRITLNESKLRKGGVGGSKRGKTTMGNDTES